MTVPGRQRDLRGECSWPRSATSAGSTAPARWSPISVLTRASTSQAPAPATVRADLQAGLASARWALVEAARSRRSPARAAARLLQRVRARRGHNVAVVAVARKLAVLFWCMLTREEDYAHQQPSLTAKKLRLLEIRAGAPTTARASRPGSGPPGEGMRQAERSSPSRPRPPTERSVADWQAGVTQEQKAGASVTPGRAS